MTAHWRSAAPAVVLLFAGGCATAHEAVDPPRPSPTTATPTATGRPEPSLAAAVRDWEARTGDLFKRSALALQRVSRGTDADDEAAVWSGCRQLHDINAVELQHLLPTPDPDLTAELQRMIDDMNIATHACLRFVIARQPGDTRTYQEYLEQAVDHLQRAKVILDADLRRG